MGLTNAQSGSSSDKAMTGLIIAGGLVALFLVYKVFRGLGLIKSGQELAEEKNASNVLRAGWFKPDFYKAEIERIKKSGRSVSVKSLFPNSIYFYKDAKKIWDSKGFFKDNESAAIGVMKSYISKSEVSIFSDYFNKQYGRDLIGFMETYMNDKQLSLIYEATSTLKNI